MIDVDNNEFKRSRIGKSSLLIKTQPKNIPFSAGRRNCIGSGFAMQEMKIMLLRICSRLKIENEIIEKDAEVDRPVLKQKLLWKLKPNSLNQRFTYIL